MTYDGDYMGNDNLSDRGCDHIASMVERSRRFEATDRVLLVSSNRHPEATDNRVRQRTSSGRTARSWVKSSRDLVRGRFESYSPSLISKGQGELKR